LATDAIAIGAPLILGIESIVRASKVAQWIWGYGIVQIANVSGCELEGEKKSFETGVRMEGIWRFQVHNGLNNTGRRREKAKAAER
jgi:hypothetical protein